MTRARRFRLRPALRRCLTTVVAATVLALGAPTPAQAGDPGPFEAYDQWVGGSTVSVGGVYTPLVGNFGGGRGDDIFWYAPGPTPDYLWISSTTRGSFTKIAKPVSGTYTPLVGDFAGDTYEDIFWYGSGAASDSLWTSVDNPGYFSVSAKTVNGVYQPTVLDQAIPYALALRDGGSPDYSGVPKDHIIWYRPGAASDILWMFNSNGTYNQTTLAIDGSPILVPLNANGDTHEDLLAYQPGSGADALFIQDTGAYTKTSKAVNGTYTPRTTNGGFYDSIIWWGPGAATDAYWANGEFLADYASTPTAPIGTTGAVVPLNYRSQTAYLYDPNGDDKVFDDGLVFDALDVDQGSGARVLTGDFDNDYGLDAFFYRPGSGAEAVAFGFTPIFL